MAVPLVVSGEQRSVWFCWGFLRHKEGGGVPDQHVVEWSFVEK